MEPKNSFLKIPPLNNIRPVHTTPPHFFKIQCNIILPPISGFSKRSLAVRLICTSQITTHTLPYLLSTGTWYHYFFFRHHFLEISTFSMTKPQKTLISHHRIKQNSEANQNVTESIQCCHHLSHWCTTQQSCFWKSS